MPNSKRNKNPSKKGVLQQMMEKGVRSSCIIYTSPEGIKEIERAIIEEYQKFKA